jgi:AcrR family transcriptional regulator
MGRSAPILGRGRARNGGQLTTGDRGRREQRRTQRQDLSRGQLLDAAERVFGAKGFHDASLKEIAEMAEFSVGSVYSFFDGKDDLFRQMFVRRGAEFMLGMHAILDGECTATEKLHLLIDFQIDFFRRLRPFGRLLLRYGNALLLADPNELDAVMASNFAESMRLQSELFAHGQTTGEFRAGDATVLAHLFSGMIAAYQSVDPSIMSDGLDTGERLPLPELHQLIARAFSV